MPWREKSSYAVCRILSRASATGGRARRALARGMRVAGRDRVVCILAGVGGAPTMLARYRTVYLAVASAAVPRMPASVRRVRASSPECRQWEVALGRIKAFAESL